MPQSLAKNLIHLIYSTKNRERVLNDAIRDELHPYSAGVLREWDSPAVLINSVEDHIHFLFSLSKNNALCDIVEQVKKNSSKWLKTKGPAYSNFFWQAGYGAFSASQSSVKSVMKDIEDQKEHHRTKSFQDEFRAFLKRYEIPYDERYVWD